MPAFFTTTSTVTVFNLEEYAHEANAWDKTKPHPMTHTLKIVSRDGSTYEIFVGQLESVLKAANDGGATFPSLGKFIDYCLKYQQEQT